MTDILTQVAQIEAEQKSYENAKAKYGQGIAMQLHGSAALKQCSDLLRIIKGLLDGLEREKLATILAHEGEFLCCLNVQACRASGFCQCLVDADAIRQSLNLTSEGDGK